MTDSVTKDSGKEFEKIEYSFRTRAFYWIVQSMVRIIMIVLFHLKVRGKENEPRSGRFIIASNHIAILDPAVVAVAIRRPVTIIAKKELFTIPVFSQIIRALHAIPVDRAGYSRGVLEKMRAQLESEKCAFVFPEGTRQRNGKLGEGKIGVGMLAIWTQAPIVPVYVSGTDDLLKSLFFRNRVRVALGDPIIPPVVSGAAERKAAYQKVTDEVMSRIADLKAKVDNA